MTSDALTGAARDAAFIREELFGVTPLQVIQPLPERTMEALAALARLLAAVEAAEKETLNAQHDQGKAEIATAEANFAFEHYEGIAYKERARADELKAQVAGLVAAVTWWRDFATNGRLPESPYPPMTYGVPYPPPGVA